MSAPFTGFGDSRDMMMTTATGQWHWSVHYRAGARGRQDWVWLYQGQRVIADTVAARRRRNVSVILKNIEGLPQYLPTLTLGEFRKQCKAAHQTLAQAVFGEPQ
jgi:hypothetical protein